MRKNDKKAAKKNEAKKRNEAKREAKKREAVKGKAQKEAGMEKPMDGSWGYADGRVVTFKAMNAVDRAVAVLENATQIIESSNLETASLFQLYTLLEMKGYVSGFKILVSHLVTVENGDTYIHSMVKRIENIDAECEKFANGLIKLHYCIVNKTESPEKAEELSCSLEEMANDINAFLKRFSDAYAPLAITRNRPDFVRKMYREDDANKARLQAFLNKKPDYSGGKRPVRLVTPKIDQATGKFAFESRTIPASA